MKRPRAGFWKSDQASAFDEWDALCDEAPLPGARLFARMAELMRVALAERSREARRDEVLGHPNLFYTEFDGWVMLYTLRSDVPLVLTCGRARDFSTLVVRALERMGG